MVWTKEEIKKNRKKVAKMRKEHLKKPSLIKPVGKCSFDMVDMFGRSERDKLLYPSIDEKDDGSKAHHLFSGADINIMVPHSGQVCIDLRFRNATMSGTYNDIEAFKDAVNELYKNWKNKYWEQRQREG